MLLRLITQNSIGSTGTGMSFMNSIRKELDGKARLQHRLVNEFLGDAGDNVSRTQVSINRNSVGHWRDALLLEGYDSNTNSLTGPSGHTHLPKICQLGQSTFSSVRSPPNKQHKLKTRNAASSCSRDPRCPTSSRTCTPRAGFSTSRCSC